MFARGTGKKRGSGEKREEETAEPKRGREPKPPSGPEASMLLFFLRSEKKGESGDRA